MAGERDRVKDDRSRVPSPELLRPDLPELELWLGVPVLVLLRIDLVSGLLSSFCEKRLPRSGIT